MTAGDSFGRLDDDDYPAYTMGRAAEMLGTTPSFLRALGEARLITPLRSEGGHRRYSRYQLRIAARARELVDHGTPIEAACRIIILEDQLASSGFNGIGVITGLIFIVIVLLFRKGIWGTAADFITRLRGRASSQGKRDA